MSHPPPPTQAKTDLAALLGENCVRIQAAADRAVLFEPLAQKIAEALIALLTGMLNLFTLWREGNLPAPLPAPRPAAPARPARPRRSTTRRRCRPNASRPAPSRPDFVRTPAPACATAPEPSHRPPPATRPVERYPKPA